MARGAAEQQLLLGCSEPRVQGELALWCPWGTGHCEDSPQGLCFGFTGVKNSLMAHDMVFEVTQAPWSPEQQIERPRLTKRVLDTEDQAAFLLHSKLPRYIYFAANSKNKWGHQRGYRIQITSSAGDHIPEASSMERAISWARSGCSGWQGRCPETPSALPAGKAMLDGPGWEAQGSTLVGSAGFQELI